jgi:broad specificity phosphatase PhoE
MPELQELLLVRHGQSTANAKGIWQGQMEFPLSERGRVQAGLSERNGGILEGHTWAEQEQRNPDLAKKFLAIPEEERWALVGAETDEEVIARFEEALSSIRTLHPGGSRIVVVSHGGVMRAFLRELFGPELLPGAQRAANASITRLQWGEMGPRLLEVASTAHLAEDPGSSTIE